MITAVNQRPTGAPEPMTQSEQHTQHTCRLSPVQVRTLLKGLDPQRVQRLAGKGSYVEQWDVRRWLMRIFGVGGWSEDTLECTLLREHSRNDEGGKPRHSAAYRARVRLTICAPCGHEIAHFDGGAVHGMTNMPSYADAHDEAMKGAMSGALKRAAMNLGDQFGLSLYNGGSTERVVLDMLPYWERPEPPEHDDPPVLAESSTGQPASSKTSRQVAAACPAAAAGIAPADRLRRAAADAGLSPEDLEDGFLQTYGVSVADGSIEQITSMMNVIVQGMAA